MKFSLENENNKSKTSIEKKTSIGLLTQFNSFTPVSYKIGIVRCLIHRVFKIISSYIIFDNELEKNNILLHRKTCTLKALLIIKLKPFSKNNLQ